MNHAHGANCPPDSAHVNQYDNIRMPDPDHDDEPNAPRRGALIALLVIAVLVAGGVWLSQSLRGSGQIQDCVMAGRTNCAPLR